MRSATLVAALTLCLPALADDELTPEKTAKIEREKTKAMDAIDKKYGKKQSSELTSDERKAIISDRAAAERGVFEKNGVSAKSYTSYTSKMSVEDRAATKAADARLEEREKAAAAKEEKEKAGPPKEIPIQRGFSDSNPVVMEEKAGAAPIVEKGLPQDAQDDQLAAGGTGAVDSSSAQAPAKEKGKGKKK